MMKIAFWQHFRNSILINCHMVQYKFWPKFWSNNPTTVALPSSQAPAPSVRILLCDQRTHTSDAWPEPQSPSLSLGTDNSATSVQIQKCVLCVNYRFLCNRGTSGDCQKEILCNRDRILKSLFVLFIKIHKATFLISIIMMKPEIRFWHCRWVMCHDWSSSKSPEIWKLN